MSSVSRFVRSVAIVGAMTLVLGACDWTMFGYNPAHARYNTTEKTIGVGNVASLTQTWSASTGGDVHSSPAVANGVVYVGSEDTKLYAFNAVGNTNCSGTPKTCRPLWTAETGNSIVDSSPAVSNGVVYVGSGGLVEHKLFAFDAAGNTNCSGSPKTCAPLWTAFMSGPVDSSPAVTNGRVYIGSADGNFYAFDAAGHTNCSGTPKVCQPLWTATAGAPGFGVTSSPAVANGVVYVGSGDHHLYAFDAAGNTNCSGTPKTCTPLWTADLFYAVLSSPAVSNGMLYIANADGTFYAFDAAGNTNCSDTPKTCTPLWTGAVGHQITSSSPAVANGVVYFGSLGNGTLYAFDAAGQTNCSGSPVQCQPLWSATGPFGVGSSPAVANGVVYVGSANHDLYAFDAAGNTNCSGTPKTCTPLWTAATGDQVVSSPSVANGWVYVGSNDNNLYAYTLPTP